MDLEISGRSAIVCASSAGLGLACAVKLAEAGCMVTINGRDKSRLEETVRSLRKRFGMKVTSVCADISTAAGQRELLAQSPEPDVLITNNGGPKPTEFCDLSRQEILDGVIQNLITPVELIQSVVRGMMDRRFGRIINIVSSSVKSPILGLDLSSGARAGLIALTANIAREATSRNVTINHILPGMFDTERQRSATEKMAVLKGVAASEIASLRQKGIPAQRLGRPEELGALCAFLCSYHAGYITGQSILIDGGNIKTTF